MRADLFGPAAARYEAWYATPAGRLILATERRAVLSALRPQAGQRILDLGTGTAVFARAIAATGATVVGVDISAGMLREARRHTDVAMVRGDAQQLPFADAAFDGLASVTTFEFVADRRRAVAEAARVIRPGGAMVIGVLNARSPWAVVRRIRGGDPIFAAAHHFRAHELRSLLRPYGAVRIGQLVHFPQGPQWLIQGLAAREPQLASIPGGALLLATVTVGRP